MFFACLLYGTTVYLFAVFYWLRRCQMRVFKDTGIPGPEPNFLFGNLIAFRGKMMWEQYQVWKQTFGDTFGYFEGPTPVLVTSNPDILHQVFVKKFNNFHARKLWPVQVDPDKSEEVHLFFARGQRWKRLRSAVNPAFSASKLRKMQILMSQCTQKLMDVVGRTASESPDQSVEFLGLFRRLTSDVIVGCGLGIEQDAIHNPSNEFLVNCQGVLDDTTKQPVLFLLGFMLPTLNKLWMWIYKFMHNIKFNPVYWLEERLTEYLSYRKNSTEHYEDFLQQLLKHSVSARTFHDLETECGPKLKVDHNCNEVKSTAQPLTDSEIVAHSFLFVVAGYETSSTTLAYIFYELATNPEVQDELRKEIRQNIPGGVEPSYDNLRSLKYMDMVVNETLRKYPLASTVIARQCQSTCEVQGLTIPSGMLVQANVWALHRDPRHWGPDPDTFDPTRFSPENSAGRHPMAWMPFGAGPRMCVGLRFAVLQVKLSLACMLRRFSVQPSPRLQRPLRLKEGATIMPAEGVTLRCVPLP